MKSTLKSMASRLLALLAALALGLAQGGAQAHPAHSYSQQELDQMLAPIALYPDALLSQILMAATYPREVAEAARWARLRPDLPAEEAIRAAETENWDPSVRSLLAFPQVLARMGENLQWTQALGDAFLDQQVQVMDTVQALRRRAQAAGNLRSDDRVSVIENGQHLLVQPFDPRVVYVPYYDPLIVYGPWWWPAYPPMYLRPWPGYRARPAYAGGFYWGPPIGISAGFFFGGIDWHRRHVSVVRGHNHYYSNSAAIRQANASAQANAQSSANRTGTWHHEPDHRRGFTYRSLEARQRFGAETRPHTQPAPAASIEIRIEGRRPEVRPEARAAALPSRDPALARSVNAIRAEPSARLELPRAPGPRMAFPPAQSAARQEPAHTVVARHEPAGLHPVAQASAPRAEIRPHHGAAGHEAHLNSAARPKNDR
jgi:hypothetical protein